MGYNESTKVARELFILMNKNIFGRRGEGSTSVVAIVAILIIVLLAVYFLFFRGSSASAPSDVNVNLPDTVNVTQDQPAEGAR